MSNTLFDALLQGRSTGNGDLFIAADGSTCMSDQAFFDLVGRLSTLLIHTGVLPGERVAVQVPKCIEALALYVACLRAGAVFLPLNTAYTESELTYFINDAAPTVLVVDAQCQAMGERLMDASRVFSLATERGVACGGSVLSAAANITVIADVVTRHGDDLAAILYTSGTTGRSKGAMLTHDNLLSNGVTLVNAWRFTANDVLLHALPIFHTHGLFVACNVLMLSGGRMLFQPGFSTDAILGALSQATTLMGVPTFYTRLLADQRFSRDCVNHMRLFVSGSAPLLADTHRAFEQRTGQRILERYGMTETNMNTSNPYEGERIAGTVGPPLPGVEVRICDAHTGAEVAPGDVGVLQVRGPNVFVGYWQMPDKTREELLPDGFFITGDLAIIDEKGYVTIVGRSKDLIICGGYNIYPKELEQVIDQLPGVSESAVVGVPHTDFGEAVVAAVVAEPTAVGRTLNGEQIITQLGESLARFKLPRKVFFVDELPRNTMGKVQKNRLREQWQQVFS